MAIFDFCADLDQAGAAGLLIFGLLAVPACVAFVPVTVLAVLAGFLFGVMPATLVVSLAGTLGAGLAFLLGRTLLRNWVEGQLTRRPRCRALVEAVGRQGFQIVFLTRLSPVVPSNFLNYVFGLTRTPLRRFLAASWLGMLPGTLFYASVGAAVKSMADGWAGHQAEASAQLIFVCFGATATLLATLYVTRLARRSIREALVVVDRETEI
jgi:uncharacterized membrane protein YdjX (TVP38/TMEM64 family)